MDYRNEMKDLVAEFRGMPTHTLSIHVKQRMLRDLRQYQESVSPVSSRSKRNSKLGALGAGAAAIICAGGLLWGYVHQVAQHAQYHTTASNSTTTTPTPKWAFVQPQSALPGYKIEYQRVITGAGANEYYFEEVKNQVNNYDVTELKTPLHLQEFYRATGLFTKSTTPYNLTRPFTYEGVKIGRDIDRVGIRSVSYAFVDGPITYQLSVSGGNSRLDLKMINSLLHQTSPIPNDTPVQHQKQISQLPSTSAQ